MTPSKNRVVSAAALGAALLAVGPSLRPAFAESPEPGLRGAQAADVPPSGVLAPPDGEDLDWTVLNWDPSRLTTSSVKIPTGKTLPSAWQTKAGVDPNKANQPAAVGVPINPDSLSPGAGPRSASDAAWANVTAPGLDAPIGWDKTTFDARFDPVHEERKFGTTLSKSVPLDERFSVTLQNGYSVTQTPSAAQAASAVPYAGHDAMSSHYGADTTAKFNMLPTGTSLTIGTAMSTVDDKWRRSLGAEQKLFGGVSVKGTVTESAVEGGAADRSLTAGFKRTW